MQRSVDGHPIEVHDVGDGVPVLMLHGFGPDHRSLLASVGPVFERRPGYRRIHVDLPGFGASPAHPAIDSSDAMVAFLNRLIDVLIGDAPMLLVGESWGGYLVRGIVGRRPDQVLGVALVIPVVIAERSRRDLPPATLLYEDPTVLDAVGPVDAAMMRDGSVSIDDAAWEYARTAILPAIAIVDEAAQERIGERYSFASDVDEIGEPFLRPSLIVTGRQDSVVGYRDSLGLIERFPRATFAILDLAGHMLPGERPHLWRELVDDWLDRVERSRSGA
jgi:pimeloyl-ACP methyl ester carboxylesterase